MEEQEAVAVLEAVAAQQGGAEAPPAVQLQRPPPAAVVAAAVAAAVVLAVEVAQAQHLMAPAELVHLRLHLAQLLALLLQARAGQARELRALLG